jgi:hypothetical protein
MAKFNWNAAGTEKGYVGDDPHPYSASGTVGADDSKQAKEKVTEHLTALGCTTPVLRVTPASS